MNSFGENLKKIRKSKGISQKELANILSISQGTIGNYEKDNRFPKEKIMIKLADYFDVSVDYLIGRSVTDDKPIKNLNTTKYLNFRLIDNSFYEFAMNYFFDLIIKNDIESAYSLLCQIYTNGGDLIDIYNKVFAKSLIKLGELWERGEIDVATEHQFSSLCENVMTRLHFKVKTKSKMARNVLCMCVKNEKHIIASKMLANFVDYLGYESFYIGANVPHKDLEGYVDKNKIDLLIVSVTMRKNQNELDDLLNFISKSKILNSVDLILGGQFFNDDNMLTNYKAYNIMESLEELRDNLGKYNLEGAKK